MSTPTNRSEATLPLLCALHDRRFRIFFCGQSVSLIGTWMQQVAIGWLVYRLTKSPWWLGAVAFTTQVPTFFFAPFAGVLADQWNRWRILVITQSLALIQSVVLVALTGTGTITVLHLLLLGFTLGCINAVDFPARQSFLIELVETKENLANAIALNAFLIHAARVIGPAVAGLLVYVAGEQLCFVFNASSYVAILFALARLRSLRHRQAATTGAAWSRFKAGAAYAFGSPALRAILLLVGATSFLAIPYATLMPLFAAEKFHGTSRTFGILLASAGVGALVAALKLAARRSAAGLEQHLVLTSALLGAGLIGFALSDTLWLSVGLLVVIGFATTIQITASGTILQTLVSEQMRGRVMSFFTMAFIGTVPFGNLLAGRLASQFGPSTTLIIDGLGCLVVTAIFGIQLRRWKHHVASLMRQELPMAASSASDGAS
jgi:MFS family permease